MIKEEFTAAEDGPVKVFNNSATVGVGYPGECAEHFCFSWLSGGEKAR